MLKTQFSTTFSSRSNTVFCIYEMDYHLIIWSSLIHNIFWQLSDWITHGNETFFSVFPLPAFITMSNCALLDGWRGGGVLFRGVG